MTSGDLFFETGHSGLITDISVHPLGNCLATGSEDGTIQIYSLIEDPNSEDSKWQFVTALDGNDEKTDIKGDHSEGVANTSASPVICLAWAPSIYYEYGLVVCTENRQVTLWSAISDISETWCKTYKSTLLSPGLCVAWAPEEYGKLFSVGCTDGTISVFTGSPNQVWEINSFQAHKSDCCGLSWAPFFPTGALLIASPESEQDPEKNDSQLLPIPLPRMVTCSRDHTVKTWQHSFKAVEPQANPNSSPLRESIWTPNELETELEGNWTTVSWAPNLGLPFTYVAAGSEEGFVAIWSQSDLPSAKWRCTMLPKLAKVTKLSWSSSGTFLLVSCSDGTASIWKEDISGTWSLASELTDTQQ